MASKLRILALAALALLVVSFAGPAAVAQDGPAPSSLIERETVQAKLSPSGEVGRTRVYSHLVIQGDGTYTITDPASTRGLRNLEGFQRPSISNDAANWTIDVDGTEARRTVATFEKDLPVSLEVTYELDGEPIEASDLVGRDGDLTVVYRIRNVSGAPTAVEYKDSKGNRVTETADVVIPLAGSLTMTLPSSFREVDAHGGVAVGDGRGNTRLSYTTVLFEPLGAIEQELRYTARVTDAVVPPVTLQVVPVNADQSPLSTGAKSFGDAADGLYELARGAGQIDDSVIRLAGGTGQVLDGLVQLADGAEQLDDGLGTAASGSGQLAGGLDRADAGGSELATGLGQLRSGAGTLSDGLGSARAGGSELSGGLFRLRDGAVRLANGLGDARSGGQQLAGGLGQLQDGAGALSAGLGSARTGSNRLASGANELGGGTQAARSGAGRILAGLRQIEAGLVQLDGQLPAASAGAARLLAGVQDLRAALGEPGLEGTVLDGLARLAGEGPYTGEGLPAAKAGVDALATQLAPAGGEIGTARDNLALQQQLIAAARPACDVIGSTQCGDALDGARDISVGVDDGLAGLETQLEVAGGVLAQISAGLERAVVGATRLSAGVTTLAGRVESGDASDPGLVEGAAALSEGLTAAVAGVGQLAAGATQAVAGQEALAGGLGQLAGGAGQLAGGAGELAGGLEQLDDGGRRLAVGARDAAAGAGSLSSGLGQLDDGGRQLRDGAGDAAAGGARLADGLRQLDDGGRQLADGAGRAADGSSELASGLGQLSDGGRRLADGLGSAADGSGRLADGLGRARLGQKRVADGAQELTDRGTSQLASGVNDGYTAQNRNVAMIRALDERSRADGMPYGAPDGAEGSAVYQFELAGADGSGRENATRILLALGAFAGLGVIAGVRRRSLGVA